MRMAAGMGAHKGAARPPGKSVAPAEGRRSSLPRRLSAIGLSSLGQRRFWHYVARHAAFTISALVVIVLNAVWIALDTQWNHTELRTEDGRLPWQPWSEVVENLFAIFFTAEIIVRFLALESKCHFYKDHPFCFDCLIVLCMVIETWIVPYVLPLVQPAGAGSDGQSMLGDLTVLRLARLVRLTRITRIMRALPELMTLIRGMLAATKAVGSILIFLVLVMYAFSIAFTGQMALYNHEQGVPNYDGDEEWCFDNNSVMMFGSIGNSMMTLFTNGVLLDNMTDVLMVLRETNLWLHWLFLLFMVISALTLLNMLIGVLCEVINKAAKQEQEESQLSIMRANLEQAFTRIDTSQDGLVSEKEWDLMRGDPNVRKSLLNLGVAELHLDERLEQMQETLFGNMIDDLSAVAEDEENDYSSEAPPEERAERQDQARYGSSHTSRKHKSRIWFDVGERAQLSSSCAGRCLTFNQFVDGILNLRPDVPASALDIEVLKERVRLEEEDINFALQKLEQRLGVDVAKELPGAQEQPSSKVESNNDVAAAPSVLGTAARPLTLDCRAEALLQQVPTQLLYHYYRTRERAEGADVHPPSQST